MNILKGFICKILGNIWPPLLIILFFVSPVGSYAQKPKIDSNCYKKWTSLDWGCKISNNGQYTIYSIKNQPTGSNTLIIKDINSSWQTEIENSSAQFATFTNNSKKVIFQLKDHKMGIIDLSTHLITYVDSVNTFTVPQSLSSNWIIYRMIGNDESVFLRNLNNNSVQKFENIRNYIFNINGSALALNKTINQDSSLLQILNLNESKIATIWNGSNLTSVVFSNSGKKVAFLTNVKKSKGNQEIWYCNIRNNKATVIYRNNTKNPPPLFIDNIESFSANENTLFLSLRKNQLIKESQNPQPVKVTLWSYSDEKLPTQQLHNHSDSRSYSAILSLNNKTIFNVENSNDALESIHYNNELGEVALVSNTKGDPGSGESNWNIAAERNYYIKIPSKNKITLIPELQDFLQGNPTLSPDANFLVYYNPKTKTFFSYEIATEITRNITSNVNTSWIDLNRDDLPLSTKSARGIAGWITKKHAVLLYDKFDIWIIDLYGRKRPVNLTNSIGIRDKIIFNIESIQADKDFSNSKEILLNAFSIFTKENGFYKANLNGDGELKKLYMGPYIFNLIASTYLPNNSRFQILKSKENNTFLIRRMSEKESPNLFITKDFINFKEVSDIHPEKEYKWLYTELFNWKSLDGRTIQGVLYKPEDFDPQKKYPIIFHYYERKSDGLHYFIQPESLTSGCVINIPTFVSDDYLVFCPDIYYPIGNPMQGTYDAIVSAANSLVKLTYIDSTKMGIQGCSFGGIQTDYLVTHTNFFSAAVSASGIADFIGSSGSITGDGSSNRGTFEIGQVRLGTSLWEKPEIYIKNSAIFSADNATTPLLLMHTTNDGVCPIEDAREFFTALRRLGKKAWLLEYDDSDHGVYGKAAEDFSIRMKQFFDYYLKDYSPPKWMIDGIPVNKKSTSLNLNLLPNGTKTKSSLLRKSTTSQN